VFHDVIESELVLKNQRGHVFSFIFYCLRRSRCREMRYIFLGTFLYTNIPDGFRFGFETHAYNL